MKRLKAILSKILHIKADSSIDKASSSNVESWDSFNALVIVSELEKEFKIKFTMNEVTSMKSVKEIKECLKKHGIALNE